MPSPPSPSSRYLTLVVVLSAVFVELIDISIVNVANPSIQSDLNTSYSTRELIIAGYQLGFACVIITSARLGDIYGRRRLFLIGMSLFTLASLACGAAPNITALIGARILQGAGSGVMFPQALSIIQETFEPGERGKAFAVFGALVGIAAIVGPLAGGGLIAWDPFGWDWRTIFFVNVPIGVTALIASISFVPESTAPDRPHLDLRGTGLATAGLFLLVYPLVEGRSQGWPGWAFAMLGLATGFLTVFAWHEVRRTRERRSPLVQMTLFRQRAFSAGSMIAVVFFAGLGAFFFVTILYLQAGFGYSALHAGLTVVPFAIGAAIASGLSNVITERAGVRTLNVGAALLVVGMLDLLATVHLGKTGITLWRLAPSLFVSGIGLGFVVAPLTEVVLDGVHGTETGSASGVLTAAQRVGGSIGVAIVGVIFFWQLSAAATPALGAVTPQLRQDLRSQGLPTTVVSEVVSGYKTCFQARADSADPNSTPAACHRLEQEVSQAPLPTSSKKQITSTIVDEITPHALGRTFSRALEAAILYEIAIFAVVFGLVFLLPRVRPSGPRVKAGGNGHRTAVHPTV